MMTCNMKQTCTPWNGCKFEFSKPIKFNKPQCPCTEKIKDVQSDIDTVKGDIARNTQTIKSDYDRLTEQIGDLAELHHNDYEYTINYINEKDAENDYLLELETLRALQAESDLDDKIITEKNRALQAEDVLNTKLNQEISDRTQADNQEKTERINADNQLQQNINTLNDKVDANKLDIESKLTQEVNRATAAEDGLDDKIVVEKNRAISAEQLLDNKIDNETTRATAEEGRLLDVIDTLESKHDADINTVNRNIDNRINQLINGAPAALDTLGEIADQLRNDENAVTALVATIAHETSDRQAADSDLLTRLQNEIIRSTTKDGEHDGAISQLATRLLNEINRSTAKDNSHDDSVASLTSNLLVETARSVAKDNAHDSAIADLQRDVIDLNSALSSEITRSTNKDTSHDNAISTLLTNLSTEITRSVNKDNAQDVIISNIQNSILSTNQDLSSKADKVNITAGTYNKVTVNSQGIVTNGENPNTLAGHGITDAYKKSEVDALILQLTNRIAALESDVAVLKTYWQPLIINGENLLSTGYIINTSGYR